MELLRNIALFKDLSVHDFASLEKITAEVSYPKSTVIFREGDDSDAFYVIQGGRIGIHRGTNPDGTGGTQLAMLDAGNFFGEMGVIDDTPRTGTARCEDDSTLLKVKKTDFNNLLALNPGIAKKIMVTITQRLQPQYDMVASVPRVSASSKRNGKVLVINSMTGGAGKTSIVCNLGYELHKVNGAKVCLVDGSIQFNDLPVFLDVIPKLTLQQLAEETEITMEMLQSGYINSTNFNVDFIAAPIKPEYFEAVTPDMLRFVLNILKGHYDFIVVDTNSMMQEPLLTLLEMADDIYYLMTPDIPAMKNTRLWLELIRALEFAEEKVHLVINKYVQNSGVEPKAIEDKLKLPVAGVIPYDFENALDCVNKGVLITVAQPNLPLSKAIKELATKIASPDGVVAEVAGGGWFGGLKKSLGLSG